MSSAVIDPGSPPARLVTIQDDRIIQSAVVPPALTSFVGRQREIEACLALLTRSDVRIVTLTGPGGAGKTRLAMRLGQELADAFETIWFVGLSAIRDPGLVLPTIAEALGIRVSGNSPVLESIATLVAERQVLLVLDNVEQVRAAAPQLTELVVRCAHLKLLVTSREVLHLSGEQNYPVPPLTVPGHPGFVPLNEIANADAVALFVQRATLANPEFVLTTANATAIVDICSRLDGLPLAIELAAARSRLLTPTAMLSRISRSLSLLTGGPRDQPRRLQTMRDAIVWSHDLLSPIEQRAFRRISVFVDGFTLDAAQSICEAVKDEGTRTWEQGTGREESPVPSVLSLLEALLDKSLVRQEARADGEPRFWMLETIREFGMERLAESTDETEIRNAHALYYLNLAQQADVRWLAVGSAIWGDQLAVERANLRAAIARALENDWIEQVLRLAGGFAYARGLPAEELAWIEVALSKRDVAPVEVQVDALFTATALAQLQGDFAKSNRLSEDGLAMSRAIGYHFGEGRALLTLGVTAEWQGDLDAAAEFYEASHRAMEHLSDRDQRSHLTVLPLANLADIAMLRGDYARAETMAMAAVARWREDGYAWGIAQGLGTVAAALCEMGKHEQAAVCYEEALDHWIACDLGRGIAGTIAGIAGVSRARGQLKQAARLLGAAWGLSDRLGVRYLAHHLYVERVKASVRARMDITEFQAAWDDGYALSLKDGVTEARMSLAATPINPRPTDGLTRREREVLRLLTAGHPDREIAELLSISPRTVQSHVGGLFAKLGVNSRAEAVAHAIRRGLV